MNIANAARVRQIATTLENIACATPWRPQCTSAGACHSGIDTSAPPNVLSSSTANPSR